MARKPFKAVPLKAVVSTPGGRGRRRNSPRGGTRRSGGKNPGRGFAFTIAALFLATFTAVFFHDGPPKSEAFEAPALAGFSQAARVGSDSETAHFTTCNGPIRDNCVVDGDTFWYAGEKIRVADINTPEVGDPQCPREAQLGAQATARLQALLNEGAFTLESVDRDRDQYGRLLRTVTRQGESLGAVLVREGLAEEWRGYRGGWC